MTTRRALRIAVMAAAFVGLAALAARAQESVAASTQPAAPQTQPKGPLVFQPVQNGPTGAPEIKFSEVGNQFATLIGGYFGWMLDQSFLIGIAGYWQADGNWDRGIGYGGLELGWYSQLGKSARFGLRGLVGGGTGTGTNLYTYTVYDGHYPHPYQGPPPSPGQTVTTEVVYSSGVFVGEPQVSFILKVNDWISVDASAGYRFVAWANGLESQMRGPIGSVGIRFGGNR